MTPLTPLIIGLGGTPRENSLSRAALSAALDAAGAMGARTLLIDLGDLAMPMYNPELRIEDYPPAQAARQQDAGLISACHAMVWVCPTYHGTISGLFKNALDHVEFLSEATPPYLTGKAVGFIAINDSKTFSAMRQCAQELRGWTAPTHVVLKSSDFDDTLTLVPKPACAKWPAWRRNCLHLRRDKSATDLSAAAAWTAAGIITRPLGFRGNVRHDAGPEAACQAQR